MLCGGIPGVMYGDASCWDADGPCQSGCGSDARAWQELAMLEQTTSAAGGFTRSGSGLRRCAVSDPSCSAPCAAGGSTSRCCGAAGRLASDLSVRDAVRLATQS